MAAVEDAESRPGPLLITFLLPLPESAGAPAPGSRPIAATRSMPNCHGIFGPREPKEKGRLRGPKYFVSEYLDSKVGLIYIQFEDSWNAIRPDGEARVMAEDRAS